MTLSFMLDECVGDEVADYLATLGYDVIIAGAFMARAPDHRILAVAKESGRVLITLDKDFGDHVFRLKSLHAGVLLLRTKDDSFDNIISLITRAIDEYGDDLKNNYAVSSDRKVRLKRL